MKLNIGQLTVEVTRPRRKKSKNVSMDDIKAVNIDHIKYLKNLQIEDLRSRLEPVSFQNLENVDVVQRCLEEHGIVVVPGIVDASVVDKCRSVSFRLNSIVNNFLNSNERLAEDEDILLQKGHQKLKTYRELATYEKTAILVREGPDEGMVDVFNVDIAFPEANVIRKAYEDSGIKKVLSSLECSVDFKNLNFYLNSGVVDTRGFHADSYNAQLKAFVYLTDCLSLDHGPYTYVKGSHKDTSYRRLNQEICSKLSRKTEAPLLNRDDILPILAARGSLVISDQAGFHRGFPQGKGHERAISVMNIR